jgi:murein DD-endopeptidase MepM/ murein hydrolase activator NlpD
MEGWDWPTAVYTLSQPFIPGQHYGVDINAPCGDPIMAARDGTVIEAGWNNGYGNLVRLDHGGGVESRYAHQERFVVEVGQVLRQGQLIGYVNNTGNSRGCHLHFEIRFDGVAVDPWPYLSDAPAPEHGPNDGFVPNTDPPIKSWTPNTVDSPAISCGLPSTH